jgi:hypothetical protein
VRNHVVFVLLAVVLSAATPAVALAEDAHAPPGLFAGLADTISAACPGTRSDADALVRGITAAEAAAAQPKFAACSRQIRLFEYQWKNDAADLALGAIAIARAQLNHDPQALRVAMAAAERTSIVMRRDAFSRTNTWPTTVPSRGVSWDQNPGRRTEPAFEPLLNSPVQPSP